MPSETIRVLFLTNNPNRGSTSRPTEGWFTYLVPKGLKAVLASDSSGSFQDWILERDIPSYEVPLRNPDKLRLAPFLISLWRLIRITKRHRIQLIHCMEQDVYPIGKYLSRFTKIPLVATAQYTLSRSFCEWAFSGGPKPKRLFFVSKGSLEACRPAVSGLVDESSWRVLYNSVDPAEFKPDPSLGKSFREEHGLGNTLLIGTASALRPRKQLDHMFSAIELMKSRGIDNFKFVLAGGAVSGDEEYAEKLLRSARKILGDRFVELGQVSDLRPVYNALDLYLHTSQEEGCSLSILEAMSIGCPVLGYVSIAADEQVLPDGGEIVEQDNIEALSVGLERWLADRKLLNRTRSLARQRVLDDFSSEKISNQLWGQYQEVVQKG